MKPQIIDLTKILKKKHEKKWVALTRDNKKVVDFDVDLITLDSRVNKDEVVYMKAPPADAYLCL